jgi:hypothetical protein
MVMCLMCLPQSVHFLAKNQSRMGVAIQTFLWPRLCGLFLFLQSKLDRIHLNCVRASVRRENLAMMVFSRFQGLVANYVNLAIILMKLGRRPVSRVLLEAIQDLGIT